MSCSRRELVSLLSINDAYFSNLEKVDQAKLVMCKIKEYNDYILNNNMCSNMYSLSTKQLRILDNMNRSISNIDFSHMSNYSQDIKDAYYCIFNYFYNNDNNVYNEEVNRIKDNIENLFYTLNDFVLRYNRIN